ncbi:hypothetical protein CPZ06_10225, partial [Lactobacillus acidophilus]
MPPLTVVSVVVIRASGVQLGCDDAIGRNVGARALEVEAQRLVLAVRAGRCDVVGRVEIVVAADEATRLVSVRPLAEIATRHQARRPVGVAVLPLIRIGMVDDFAVIAGLPLTVSDQAAITGIRRRGTERRASDLEAS